MSTVSDPPLLYITLILPSIFSLTLILEGIYKFMEKKSGWIPLFLGSLFILVTVAGYFFVK